MDNKYDRVFREDEKVSEKKQKVNSGKRTVFLADEKVCVKDQAVFLADEKVLVKDETVFLADETIFIEKIKKKQK
ncbi:MAG: hypothetical protein HY063_04130 [Bacteroidetes bacterium]|nr:hypothetical protein [Bacteroidota bacterium]